MNNNDGKSFVPYIAIVITVCLWLAALFLHPQRFWGLDLLTYFPLPLALIYIVFLAVLTILLTNRLQSSSPDKIKPLTSARWKRIPAWSKYFTIGLIALALFWLLRDRTKLLGDSILRIGELGDKGLDRVLNTAAAEPLDFLVHYGAYKGVFLPLGFNTVVCCEIISYLAGLIYIWAAWLIAHQLKADKKGFWLPFLYLLGWGGIFMFFGYAEAYGLAAPFMLLFLYYAIRYFNKGKGIVPVVITFLIGFFLHNLLLILFPSILYLLLIEYKSNRKRAIFSLAAMVIPMAIWLSISYAHKESGAFLLPESGTEPGYLLWSGAHLVDIVNELFLACPAILVLLLLQKKGAMPTPKDNRLRLAIILAALSGLAVLIFVDPQLGMARDWDLFALPLLALNMALYLGVDWPKVSSLLKTAVITIMLGLSFPWLLINANENLALARYQNIINLDHSRARYGYDRLGFYYTKKKKLPEAEDAYKKSLEIGFHFRTLLYLAFVQEDQGKTDEAITNLKILLSKEPTNGVVLYDLGWLYYDSGRGEEALETFRQFKKLREYAPDVDRAILNITEKLPNLKK